MAIDKIVFTLPSDKKGAVIDFIADFVSFAKQMVGKNCKSTPILIAEIIEKNLIIDIECLRIKAADESLPRDTQNRPFKTQLLTFNRIDIHAVQLHSRLWCLRLMYEFLTISEKVPKGANYRDRFEKDIIKHIDQIKVIANMANMHASNETKDQTLANVFEKVLNGCTAIEFITFLNNFACRNDLDSSIRKHFKEQYQNLTNKFSNSTRSIVQRDMETEVEKKVKHEVSEVNSQKELQLTAQPFQQTKSSFKEAVATEENRQKIKQECQIESSNSVTQILPLKNNLIHANNRMLGEPEQKLQHSIYTDQDEATMTNKRISGSTRSSVLNSMMQQSSGRTMYQQLTKKMNRLSVKNYPAGHSKNQQSSIDSIRSQNHNSMLIESTLKSQLENDQKKQLQLKHMSRESTGVQLIRSKQQQHSRKLSHQMQLQGRFGVVDTSEHRLEAMNRSGQMSDDEQSMPIMFMWGY